MGESLTTAWRTHGGDSSVRCRESLALWAALWALACERKHEMELMLQLFQLFDASEDGWLQYDEFAEFISAIAPEVGKADSEELFLCGAEEVTGDMTKEVFLALVMRLGITSDMDLLENLVASKRATMFGDRIDTS